MQLFWDNRLEYLNKLSRKDCVRFALFCAYQCEDEWKGIPECKAVIEVTERWLVEKATVAECRAAANAAAYAAAAAYATYAAYAATAVYAAAAAAYAAYAANAAALIAANTLSIKEVQMNYLYELLYIDKIFEERVLRA